MESVNVLCTAVHRKLLFISVDAHIVMVIVMVIVIVIIMVIVMVFGVDSSSEHAVYKTI